MMSEHGETPEQPEQAQLELEAPERVAQVVDLRPLTGFWEDAPNYEELEADARTCVYKIRCLERYRAEIQQCVERKDLDRLRQAIINLWGMGGHASPFHPNGYDKEGMQKSRLWAEIHAQQKQCLAIDWHLSTPMLMAYVVHGHTWFHRGVRVWWHWALESRVLRLLEHGADEKRVVEMALAWKPARSLAGTEYPWESEEGLKIEQSHLENDLRSSLRHQYDKAKRAEALKLKKRHNATAQRLRQRPEHEAAAHLRQLASKGHSWITVCCVASWSEKWTLGLVRSAKAQQPPDGMFDLELRAVDGCLELHSEQLGFKRSYPLPAPPPASPDGLAWGVTSWHQQLYLNVEQPGHHTLCALLEAWIGEAQACGAAYLEAQTHA